ncbi:MAG: hypothetical protein U0031_05910 [Thermomicrobiales bacterium]
MLWSMALLGLILLPTNYRAGAQVAHAHSLIQLWLDSASGVKHHHDAVTGNWLDPEVGDMSRTGHDTQPDPGHQEDSAPAVAGFHFILALTFALPLPSRGEAPLFAPVRRLFGRMTPVPSPPPRHALAAI